MRYTKSAAERGKKYVIDRRGQGKSVFPGGGRTIGGATGVLGLILALIFGSGALTGGQSNVGLGADTASGSTIDPATDAQAETVDFTQVLMGDLNDTWREIFREEGEPYTEVQLQLFTDSVNTNGCGTAGSNVGPFYCPAPNDQKAYIDLDFFDQLSSDFGAPGDFAQAYVLAHEVGHHVQAITGQSAEIRAQQGRVDQGQRNQLSIQLELQADCYAGVWAHDVRERTLAGSEDLVLEPGDIDEGLEAARSVGDDRIQQKSGQPVNPHNWTHGSSAQRENWFRIGFETGSVSACNLDEIR